MCDDWMDLPPPPVKRARGILGLQVHSNVRMVPSRRMDNMDEDSLPESLPPTPIVNLITDDEVERTPLREEEAVTPVVDRPAELPRVNEGGASIQPEVAGRASPVLAGKTRATLQTLQRLQREDPPTPMSASSSSSSDEDDDDAEAAVRRIREERIRRQAWDRLMAHSMRRLARRRQRLERETAELRRRLEASEGALRQYDEAAAEYGRI